VVKGVEGLIGFAGVSDLERARRFYGDVLGLSLVDESPYAFVAHLGTSMVRITAVGEPAAAVYTVLGWSVTDIAATVDDLAGRGVAFTRYGGMDQDERGVWTAPGGARVAWFGDPDGNVLSLTQLEPRV
jgi:catechol 2,3-dioxygenase-like lactoylglutathione lyase family enzyme